MSSAHPSPATPPARAGWMIAAAAAAAFLATFNETFLNVAFTPIMRDFGIGVNTVQWLATGYLLVAAAFVPVANVLYHRFPTRSLFVAVSALLVVGSVVGALAPSFGILLFARLLQAVGTGLITPLGMNITLAVSPRDKLGLTMGIMAAMTALGPSTGIVLSGALLTAPWSTLMWIFGALAIVVLLIGAFSLRTVAELGRPTFDPASFVLVVVGLVGVMYGASAVFGGDALGGALSVLVGVSAMYLFVRRQRRIDHPLIDMRPFGNRAFVHGVAMIVAGLVVVFAMNVMVPLFLQTGRGISPLGASLTMAPGILLVVAAGPVAGRLFDRFGGRWSIPLGFLAMAVFLTLVGLAAGYPSIVAFSLLYIPAVLATAFVLSPSQTFALTALDAELAPHGVTVLATSFQVAGCVGTSLAAGVFTAVSEATGRAGLDESGALLAGFRGAVGVAVVVSLIGVGLGLSAYRTARTRRSAADGTAPVPSGPDHPLSPAHPTAVPAV